MNGNPLLIYNSFSPLFAEDLQVKRRGDDTNIPENNIDSLIRYALTFPTIIRTKPVVFSVETKHITTADSLPRSLVKEDFRPIFEQAKNIQLLGETKLKTLTVVENIQSILPRARTLSVTNEKVSQAKSALAHNEKILQYIGSVVEECQFSTETCEVDKNLLNYIPFSFTSDDLTAKETFLPIIELKQYEYSNETSITRYLNFEGTWRNAGRTYDSNCTDEFYDTPGSPIVIVMSTSSGCQSPLMKATPLDFNPHMGTIEFKYENPGLRINIYDILTHTLEHKAYYEGGSIEIGPYKRVVIRPTCYFISCGEGVKAKII